MKTFGSCLLFILALVANGQSFTSTLSKDQTIYVSVFEHLIDEENTLTSHSIIDPSLNDHFILVQNSLFQSPSITGTHWLRFSIRNALSKECLLYLDQNNLWELDVYTLQGDSLILQKRLGALHLHNANTLMDRAIKGPDPNEKTTYYVRIKNGILIDLPIIIGTHNAMVNYQRPKDIAAWAFLGIAISMIIFNFFLLLSTKEKNYIWYLLHITTISILALYFEGDINLFKFFSEDVAVWLYYHPWSWQQITFLLMGIFFIRLLNLKEDYPTSYVILIVLMAIICVIMPILNIFDVFPLANLARINRPLAVAFLMFINFICLMVILQKNITNTRFLFIGWSFLILSTVFYVIIKAGYLGFNYYMHSFILYAGVSGDLLILSFAVINKMANLQRRMKIKDEEYVQLASQKADDLQKEVKKQTDELKTAIRLREKLISIIAHDIKGPIVSLHSFLALEDQINLELSQEDFKTYKVEMKNRLKQINDHIATLLLWSKSQSTGFTPNFTEIDLKLLIDERATFYSSLLKEKELTAIKDIQKGHFICTDRYMLLIVLDNIISNAIKFSPKNSEIVIQSRQNEDQITLAISDNGPGMDEEIITKMKNSEIQSSSKGTFNEMGTGLGLNIVFSLLQKLEVSFDIKSNEKGTTFSLIFKNCP